MDNIVVGLPTTRLRNINRPYANSLPINISLLDQRRNTKPRDVDVSTRTCFTLTKVKRDVIL